VGQQDTYTQSRCRSPSALRAVGLEKEYQHVEELFEALNTNKDIMSLSCFNPVGLFIRCLKFKDPKTLKAGEF
jgi:hypothetical protein